MAEIPLVVVDVQRGGPSTGQPTKAEQSDLLSACFGGHGDAPKVVMAVSSIEDCFYSIITARKIAETFNMVVVVLSDANLATAQQPFTRPSFREARTGSRPRSIRAPSRRVRCPTTGIRAPGWRRASFQGNRAACIV
jgi:pyruvate/2-oxoacid:ferredoxin oxidoreductase alpha subunit